MNKSDVLKSIVNSGEAGWKIPYKNATKESGLVRKQLSILRAAGYSIQTKRIKKEYRYFYELPEIVEDIKKRQKIKVVTVKFTPIIILAILIGLLILWLLLLAGRL